MNASSQASAAPVPLGGHILTGMDRPVAIEVRGLSKSFHIPGERVSRRRQLSGREPGRELEVLRDISFDVGQGEFFGVVGRNGSGKSTLLKLLASVYRADAGRIRIAGRLAPFLELGIGFNSELTAYDNVILNGVMMGLSAAEARHRYNEIIEFAGLEDYTDLQVKNYSSGMKVRLGFAVMTHVDADLLLVDEVLAVGDADFQEKCIQVFEQMHQRGRTIVLVTHSMPTVTDVCERALLLHEGGIDTLGAADKVAERYYEVNLTDMLADEDNTLPEMSSHIVSAIADPMALIADPKVTDGDGRKVDEIRAGEPINVEATVTIDPRLRRGTLRVRIVSHEGRIVFSSERTRLEPQGDESQTMPIRISIENPLPAGRYRITLGTLMEGEQPAGPNRTAWVTITGEKSSGAVLLAHEITIGDGAVETTR
jgi:ABC-type polysaccharide/polyol phosphate transport system ATPase subunit